MKRLTICAAAAITILALASSAGAAVLGRRFIGIDVGTTGIGDATIDRSSLDTSARIRLPVGRHVDVAFHEQALLEGADATVAAKPAVKSKRTEYGIDFACHALPGRSLNPFVRLGVSNVMAQTIVDGTPTMPTNN